jgi:hypothetical protein
MTKALITIAIVAIVALGGWQLFEYWEKVQDDKLAAEKQAASSVVNPDALPGLPQGWDTSLRIAQQQGATALGTWLKTYGPKVQDPRKAWIELDYVVMITRDKPQEAKRLFAEVKDRTLPNSPVWPRIHDLEKSYE